MLERNKRVSVFPLLMVGLGVVLMVASLIWFVNVTRENKANKVELAPSIASPRIPYPEIKRVRLGDSKAAFDLKQAIFIDTRGEPFYTQGHIPGALSYSEEELQSHLDELDPQAWYLLYCT